MNSVKITPLISFTADWLKQVMEKNFRIIKLGLTEAEDN